MFYFYTTQAIFVLIPSHCSLLPFLDACFAFPGAFIAPVKASYNLLKNKLVQYETERSSSRNQMGFAPDLYLGTINVVTRLAL